MLALSLSDKFCRFVIFVFVNENHTATARNQTQNKWNVDNNNSKTITAEILQIVKLSMQFRHPGNWNNHYSNTLGFTNTDSKYTSELMSMWPTSQ